MTDDPQSVRSPTRGPGRPRTTPLGTTKQYPAEGRWRWWYPAIADWMLRNPDKTQAQCAQELNKHPQTIHMIVGTDMFKAYLAKRRREWQANHDHVLQAKLQGVANKSLDLLLGVLETKREQVPIKTLQEISFGVLDRLGYSPRADPGVQVNVTGPQVVVAPVSVSRLEEARDVLRRAQESRAAGSPGWAGATIEQEAEPQLANPQRLVPDE